MLEVFRDVQGYENLYQVSNFGNVKSLPKGDGNGHKERILKPDLRGGYFTVTLSTQGLIQRFPVHKLVAKAFLENASNKPVVNHKNLDKLNNCVENLEWVTASENARHAYQNGALDSNFEKSAHVKHTSAQEQHTKIAKNLLGDAFNSISYAQYRWYYHFNCVACNKPYTFRSDNPRLKQKLCKLCRKPYLGKLQNDS